MGMSARLVFLARQNLAELRDDPHDWFILVGNRLLVAGVVATGFGLVVAALMAVGIVRVAATDQMIYLAQGLFTGTVTLVTIVLAINQLVLSREFATPGELQDAIEDATAYRHRVEDTTGRSGIPTTPAAFLAVLVDGTRVRAQRLGGLVAGREDRPVAEIDRLVATVTGEATAVADRLEAADQGIFETLHASLEANFAGPLADAHRLQSEYDESLPEEVHTELDGVITSLQQVDIARQYFKSLFIQSELADLSRLLLYAGVPAIAAAIVLYLVYVGGPSPAVERDLLPGFVLAVVVACFVPVAVLFSFVVRIATVAKRTVATTPFSMQSQSVDPDDSPADDRATRE